MKTRIGDISIQIRGVSYKPSDISDENDPQSIAILRANNISNHGEIETSDLVWITQNRVKPEQILRTGDILLCASSGSKGLVGKAAQVTGDYGMSFGAFCKVIRPMIANKKYLGFYFQSPQYRHLISEASAGININNIRAEDLDGLVIEIPSESEQEERCSVLGKVEKAILLRRQQIQKLNNFVKSQFIEMFGDPILNQRGWRKSALKNNAILLNGRAYKQDELLENGKYPVLRVGNFFSNRGWYYSDLELDKDKYCNDGDLIYAWSASFGPQIWNGGKVIYHYHIWKVLVGDAYNKLFLCKLLEYTTEFLMRDTHGIAMMHLTKSGMENTGFIVPPMELQEQFARFVEQTDKSKFRIKQSLEKLEILYKALLQKYFG